MSPEAVISAGPYGLRSLAHGDVIILEALRQVYAVALQRTFILALSAGCAAAVCTFGMESKNVKHEEKARREMKEARVQPLERAGEAESESQQDKA